MFKFQPLRAFLVIASLLAIAPASFAQTLYWDPPSRTTPSLPDSGWSWVSEGRIINYDIPPSDQLGNSSNGWSVNPAGEPFGNTKVLWEQGATAVFSAGNELTDYFYVYVGPNILTPSIVFQDGSVLLSGEFLSGSFFNLSTVHVAAGASGIIDTAFYELAADAPVSLTKTGPGTLTIATVVNQTTGGTFVSEGTLAINSLANLNSGDVTVQNGATLTATGELRFNSREVLVTGVGSTATTGTFIEVGHSTNGSFTITNGGSAFSPSTAGFGIFGGVTGHGLVTGSGSSLNIGTDLLLGFNGTGNLTVSNNGRVQVNRRAYLGHSGGGRRLDPRIGRYPRCRPHGWHL